MSSHALANTSLRRAPRHFSRSHPVAEVAARLCRAHGSPPGAGVGGVACGPCWEQAIRVDERVVVEHGLDPDCPQDPMLVDEVAVRRACSGERVELTAAERVAAVECLYGRGLSRGQIALRLRMAYADVLERGESIRATRTSRPAGLHPVLVVQDEVSALFRAAGRTTEGQQAFAAVLAEVNATGRRTGRATPSADTVAASGRRLPRAA